MNILLVTPFISSTRGNFITARRWIRGLTQRGIAVKLDSSELLGEGYFSASAFKPDIIHAHHAVHCGMAAAGVATQMNIPLVISIGGTDWYADKTAAPDPGCLAALARADAVISPTKETVEKLKTVVPKSCGVFYVRRGVRINPRTESAFKTSLNGLMAGGLRPVKGQLKALRWVEALRAKGIPATLTIAGPAIDSLYTAKVEQVLSRQPQDRWIGPIRHADMPGLYADADFFLNASENEGASNAILEALANGCPVAARDCPGNRHLLSSAASELACLFSDTETGLEHFASWLKSMSAQTQAHRIKIARSALRYVERRHHVEDEIEELIQVYQFVVGTERKDEKIRPMDPAPPAP